MQKNTVLHERSSVNSKIIFHISETLGIFIILQVSRKYKVSYTDFLSLNN